MSDFRVLWTDAAILDLNDIAKFIAADSPVSALEAISKIKQRCSKLERLPERGRIIPELQSVDILTYRELIVKPWRVAYRYDSKCVYVVAVLDARRNLSGLLLERLARR